MWKFGKYAYFMNAKQFSEVLNIVSSKFTYRIYRYISWKLNNFRMEMLIIISLKSVHKQKDMKIRSHDFQDAEYVMFKWND